MRSFKSRYGAGPGHLVLVAGCTILGGYAALCAWRQGRVIFIVFWFMAGLILHDVVGFPVYSYVDRFIQGRASRRAEAGSGVSWLNHVRVPLFMSGCLLVTAFPLIARLSAARYASYAGVSESGYLVHWLAVTVGLFALSGLLFGVRCWRARPRHFE
jgi:hypothetical protein